MTAAGIEYERDDEAFALNILRLNLRMCVDGERLRLIATFPDLYPFFRFEVRAPELCLPHHQNPFGKNLCLIGRGTHHWRTNDTLAGVLLEQLPRVIQTGRATAVESVRGIEQQQAEPFGVFYPYAPSTIITPDASAVPLEYECGTFSVATNVAQGAPPGSLVQGMIAEIRAKGGEQLFEANEPVLSAFEHERLVGTWVRVPSPIVESDQNQFLREVLRRCPFAQSTRPNKVEGGWLQIWGVLFPEEVKWRSVGEGWVFICSFSKEHPVPLRNRSSRFTAKKKKKKRKQGRKDRQRNRR